MAVRGGGYARCRRCGSGMFYDSAALDAAYDLVADWTAEEREAMRRDVPRLGLATPLRSRTLRDIALEMLGNLARRAASPGAPQHRGEDETHFLDPLFAIAGSGRTPAEELLEDLPHPLGRHDRSGVHRLRLLRTLQRLSARRERRGRRARSRSFAGRCRAASPASLGVVHRRGGRAAGQRHPAFAMP